jgi:preprotein translocase subunit SecF
MSKNILKTTLKKCNLWLIVAASLVIVGVVIMAIFGVSNHVSTGSYQTLTVNVNGMYEAHEETIESICDEVLGEMDVQQTYKTEIADVSREIVFVFDVETDLSAAKAALQAKFDDAMQADKALFGDIIKVSTQRESTLNNLPKGFLLRGVIAGAVFVALAFGYTWLRYKLRGAIVTASAMTVAAAVTSAVLVLTRIPLTTTVMYAVELSLILTAVSVICTLANAKKVEESEKAKELSEEDKAVAAVAVKETALLLGGLAVALAVLAIFGVFGAMNVFTFTMICLLTLVAVVFASLVFAPSLYLPVKVFFDGKQNKSKYAGAKAAKKEVTEETADEAAAEKADE